MFQKHGLRDNGTHTAAAGKSKDYDHGVQTNDNGIAHRPIVPEAPNPMGDLN
jgi:hypothetical protein